MLQKKFFSNNMSFETSASSRLQEEEWIPATAIKGNKTLFCNARVHKIYQINATEKCALFKWFAIEENNRFFKILHRMRTPVDAC